MRSLTLPVSNVIVSLILTTVLLFSTIPVLADMIVDTAWVRRYNGPESYWDVPWAIAVDDSGNAYVAGFSYGATTDEDYATVKYYPNGDTAWVRRYNGPGNGYDVAHAIVIDGSCFLYLTGSSLGEGTGLDFATIKYHPNGDTAWVRRHNGPTDSSDGARAIAVDSSGNVYVSGWIRGSGTLNDYATIKYYPNGDTAWVRTYNGPGERDDIALAVAADAFNNVCVTGYSYGGDTHIDIATIKYYPAGDTAWVRRYNGPANQWDAAYAIAADSSGNIYVSGGSSNGDYGDYVTIKYYPNGDTAWVRRYNGLGDRNDGANDVSVDASGNVLVTGRSDQQQNQDPDYDFTTIKYDSEGNELWVSNYGAFEDSCDEAWAQAIDGSDNIYVTGCGGGIQMVNNDFATVKYDPGGDELWVRRYNGPGNSGDCAHGIAIDDLGNVYVTGESEGSETYADFATVKYFQVLRGDANRDGIIDVADAVYLLNFLFKDGLPPDPFEAGDVNCTGYVTLGDAIFLLNYIFKGGPPPDCP